MWRGASILNLGSHTNSQIQEVEDLKSHLTQGSKTPIFWYKVVYNNLVLFFPQNRVRTLSTEIFNN